ncbi:MAG: radical SAM protein [Nitrosomonadaceae bacterium]
MSITDRIDGVTYLSPEFLSEANPVLKAPKSVKIELTARCNYRCNFCSLVTRQKQPGVNDDIDFELFKRITTEMFEAGVEEIGMFYIGESFMNVPLLVESIKWVKSLPDRSEVKRPAPYTFLTTNGSLADKSSVKKVMEAGLDSLKFSVTTSDPIQFQQVIGVKAKLMWQALENIKGAFQARASLKMDKPNSGRGYCELSASSIKYDGDQQKQMRRTLESYVLPYVDNHYWLPLYTFADKARENELELRMLPTAGNTGRLDNKRPALPCWLVFNEGHVTAKGLLTACGFDATDSWTITDLNEVSFMDAWNCDEFVKLREAHYKEDVTGTMCEECILYQGGPEPEVKPISVQG